jgi:hypothetical protein
MQEEVLFGVLWRLGEARDVLACRRVCRGWREVVHRHPVVGRLLGGRGNVPPDSAGESPMQRLCRAREAEEKWRKTLASSKWRRREVVGDWEGADEVEAAVHAGKYVVVVQQRTWGVWEERGGGERFEAIEHLREAHRGRFGGQMVVLRDKFVVVSVGGFVHALDCGETMDLPNILQADEQNGGCRLLACGDSVGVCGDTKVTLYTFKVCWRVVLPVFSFAQRNTRRLDGTTRRRERCSWRRASGRWVWQQRDVDSVAAAAWAWSWRRVKRAS